MEWSHKPCFARIGRRALQSSPDVENNSRTRRRFLCQQCGYVCGQGMRESLRRGHGWAFDFGHELAEVGFFEKTEPTGAIFGGKPVRIQRVIDEGPKSLSIARRDFRHGDNLVNDARKL